MPDFDGSIVINTEIDATGIQRDMKKVERAARGAGDATESIGSGFRTAERDADRAASGIQGGTRKVERAARSAGSEVEDIGSSFRDAERDAGRAARGIEDDLKDLKDSVDDVSSAISLGFGADMLVDLAGGMMDLMESTDELRGDLSMLDQNARAAGVGLGTTREAMQKLNTVSGETDSSIEAVSNLLAAGVPENRLQEAVEGLANAAITFPDTVKIESLADSLQETLATGEVTGQFAEVLDRIGYGAENFTNNLAMCTTEAEKQELALNVLTQGPLKGVYDAWAKANPELVEGRDATLELQTATAELGTALAPVITDLTELATNVVNWVAGMGNIDDVFTMIVGGIAALGAIKAIDMITRLATSLMTMDKAMLMAKASTGLAFVAFGLLFSLLMQAAGVWDSMSDAGKVVTILGAVTAAAFAAALAVGAFQSALSLGVAVVAITAGIAAMMMAINSAEKRVNQMNAATQQSLSPSAYGGVSGRSASIPALATGAVIPPNGEFLAVLGDQKKGRNLEAPENLIRQIVREESGGGLSGTLTIRPAPGLTRYLAYELKREDARAGTPLVEGTRR